MGVDARRSWTGLLAEDTPVDALAAPAFRCQGFLLLPSNGGFQRQDSITHDDSVVVLWSDLILCGIGGVETNEICFRKEVNRRMCWLLRW